MKTAEQNKEYLESKTWYEIYKRNVIHSFHDVRLSNQYLNECDGIKTIFSAFPFQYTREGTEFWMKMYMDFCNWYES